MPARPLATPSLLLRALWCGCLGCVLLGAATARASDLGLVRALEDRFGRGEAGQVRKVPVPERVLLVGSSSIEWGFGPALERELAALGVVQVRNEGQMSTGLSRPDFFDWPAHLEALLDAERPDLVVAQFGGNDAQLLRDTRRRVVARWGDPDWEAAYASRVHQIAEACVRRGVPVVFVGMPHMEDPAFAERIALVNAIVAREAVKVGARFLSTWDLTSDPDGGALVRFERDGRRYRLRRDDGIHLGKHGAPWVAELVADELARGFDLTGDCNVTGDAPPERLMDCSVTPSPADCPHLPESCTSEGSG